MIQDDLGPEEAERVFERSYENLAVRYSELGSFSTLVRLVPEALLDESKIAVFHHQQIQRIFLDKVERLQWLNRSLWLKNQQLRETRGELEKIRSELETRVSCHVART